MLVLFTGRKDTKRKRLYRNKPSGVAKVVNSLDCGLNSNWWYPHLRSNLLKTLEPIMVCNTSSTVGIGDSLRMIAWFACLMSTHADFPAVIWDDHHRVDPGDRTLHLFNYSQVQQFCGLISDLFSQIKWYPSIRLCNRFYSGVYIQGYLFFNSAVFSNAVLNCQLYLLP